MSWFTEQIETRIQQEDAKFNEACEDLYEAVTGRPASGRTYDKYQVTQATIDELLSYYHFPSVEIPKDSKDFSKQLDYVMHPLGMMWREVRLEGEWYKNAAGAMLARRVDNGQTVALIPGKLGGYTFLNRETGKHTRINKKNRKLLEETAICFYMPFPQKKLEISDLVKYIFQNISIQTILLFMIATVAITLMGLITPKLTYLLYSSVIELKNTSLPYKS